MAIPGGETGLDRVRRAIERARGMDAPQFPIRVCGPECCGEASDWLVCPGCIRFRFSPIHLLYRLIGLCDGKGWF